MLSLRNKLLALLFAGTILLVVSAFLSANIKNPAHADFLTPPDSQIVPPTNLSIHEIWVAGGGPFQLTWVASPNAVSYSVYDYDVKIASGITATSYMMTKDQSPSYSQGTVAVTATDAQGNESIPSNISRFPWRMDVDNITGSWDLQPLWPQKTSGNADLNTFAAAGEWNQGRPRITVTWAGPMSNFNNGVVVFRDGIRLPGILLYNRYIDSDVQPGSTHTYTAAAIMAGGVDEKVHATTEPVTATAPTGPPIFSSTPIVVTRVIPNDDSAKVYFKRIPGAVDYRVYSLSNHATVKYSGFYGIGPYYGDLLKNGEPPTPEPDEIDIEMNGLDPSTGADLVVEAVDKLGPFQKMDGFIGPGAKFGTSTNGMGDPSDIPIAIARSLPFHVTLKPATLTGSQAFFDTFRGSQPLEPQALTDPLLIAKNAAGHSVVEEANDKWTIRSYESDPQMSRNFIMSNHFMDTLYDGPYAGHNNNASMVMIPKQTADISDGKVVHITMEVDAHVEGRRWVDIMVGGAGETLVNAAPGKLDTGAGYPTTGSKDLLDISIKDRIMMYNYLPDQTQGNTTTFQDFCLQCSDQWHTRSYWSMLQTHTPSANGSPLNIDNRSKFDVYLSKTHYKIVETEPDGSSQFPTTEGDYTGGATLPWDKIQVYYTHELYHTGNDVADIFSDEPSDTYWANNRPWADERHWDNMGFEVLPSVADIPSTQSLLPVSEPANYAGASASPIPTPSPTPTPTPEPAPLVCRSYDLSGDGKVTLSDVVLAIQAYNGSPGAAAIALWPVSGNPGLEGLIKMIQAYNGHCT